MRILRTSASCTRTQPPKCGRARHTGRYGERGRLWPRAPRCSGICAEACRCNGPRTAKANGSAVGRNSGRPTRRGRRRALLCAALSALLTMLVTSSCLILTSSAQRSHSLQRLLPELKELPAARTAAWLSVRLVYGFPYRWPVKRLKNRQARPNPCLSRCRKTFWRLACGVEMPAVFKLISCFWRSRSGRRAREFCGLPRRNRLR